MTKKSITVAVTGLNAIDSPGPGVGIIRCLKESQDFDVRIIGLAYETLEPGIFMRDLVTKTYQLPFPSAGSEQLKARLSYIHEQQKIDLIIPSFDAELINFIKLVPELQSWGIQTFLPTQKKMEPVDKLHLHEFGMRHGFEIPETQLVNEVKDLEEQIEQFPVVVKGKFYEAYIAQNMGQAIGYFHQLSNKWGLPVILQKMVSGTEIDVAGLGDGHGNLVGAIPLRKLYITDKGKGWAGVVLGDDNYVELARKFVQETNWKGGFELELMKTSQDEYYMMEVNPRFPAWIYTAAAAGQNLPEAMMRLAMGQKIDYFTDYQVGKMFIRYSWDLITDIKEFEKISTAGEL